MEDHADAEPAPLRREQGSTEHALDPDWLGRPRQPESAAEPHHVRVDRQAGEPERDAAHDVGRLATDAGEALEILERLRDLAAKPLAENGGEPDQVLGLRAKEASCIDELLELFSRGGRECCRRREASEERGRHLVHTHVGALGGQHGRDDELERVAMPQRAQRRRGARKASLKSSVDLNGARPSGERRARCGHR